MANMELDLELGDGIDRDFVRTLKSRTRDETRHPSEKRIACCTPRAEYYRSSRG